MAERQTDFSDTAQIALTSTQIQVIDILRTAKSEKYHLADWYLGTIYTAKNTLNPDRFSQAAHSLRELLEKLPRVFAGSEVQESKPDFQGMRASLHSRMCSDKARYDGDWEGKIIDAKLDKTINRVDRYLELNQTPTRRGQIHSVINKSDPMHDILGQRIREEKAEQFHILWKTCEGLAHHNITSDETFFWEQLAAAERIIIDLLAPITAQDQIALRTIISKPHPEQDDIAKLVELIRRRGANYAYFFRTADSPAWITPLIENGFFNNPPNVEAVGDGRVSVPIWWPIFYLQKVSVQLPKMVVDILCSMEQTDNPRVLREIFSIACDLPDVTLSLRLVPLIKRFLHSPYRWGEAGLIVKILGKWGEASGPARDAAFEIVQCVIAFHPDPKQDKKRTRRKESPEAIGTLLEPAPRFDEWEYKEILEKGVRPLSEKEPYQVASFLVKAVANAIRMGSHQGDVDKLRDEDYSEIWCPRLDKTVHNYVDAKEELVHTMTYACEQVYEKALESIEALDKKLRNQRWKVLRRLRQQLYAHHPNDQTLPWISELILRHADYGKWEHHYEFQLMIRKASEHFGTRLLTQDERSAIFDKILQGPSKEDFSKWMGERYSEESYQKHQRDFHRMQLRPFAALLNDEIRRYLDELEGEEQAEVITDDSYSPYGGVSGGTISYRSPRSVEDLEKLTNRELLTYLNDWNEEYRDKDNWLVEINISALADVFKSLFKRSIVSDSQRLGFWIAHRDEIRRPIYVAAMIKTMQENVKDKNFGNLDQWIEFCAWALSHPESERIDGQPEPREESRDHPDWGGSRRAVVDFIDACVSKDIDVPLEARGGLAKLLERLCNEFDWRLDQDRPVLLNRDDPITEAINNTRSRALESLVNFGFWIRRRDQKDSVPEVANILSRRMAEGAKFPLSGPEHALLGMEFSYLFVLNQDWAVANRATLFPQGDASTWSDAFGSYLRFNRPFKAMFEILRSDFEHALENIKVLSHSKGDKDHVATLGQHLFTYYYFWELFPLTGAESLLERFYEQTSDDRKRWADLFDHVGRVLSNSGKNLEESLANRAIAYFDWRVRVAEPLELQKFEFWLEAECFGPEWRLRSYAKVLDHGLGKDVGLYLQIKALNKLLPYHLPLVVECFAKITDAMDQNTQMYISADDSRPILKAGLKSEDPQVRKNAERARENLLKLGRFDYLDLGEAQT